MNELVEQSVTCPYCGESIDVLIDQSELQQNYIEDCQVCCRPINFVVIIDHDSNIDLTVKKVKIIEGVNGRELEIKTQIDPGNSSFIDIDVFRSEDGQKRTTLRLSRTETSAAGIETWLVDFPQFPGKDHRGWSETPPEEPITFTRLSTEPIDLHLFLDRSLVEVYVNKQAFLPKYIYATENRTGVSTMVDGTGAKINTFKAWQMVAELYKPKPEF